MRSAPLHDTHKDQSLALNLWPTHCGVACWALGTDNGLAEASAGVAERSGDEGATFGQRVADKTDSIMDVAAAKLRGAAGGALPDDDAVRIFGLRVCMAQGMDA